MLCIAESGSTKTTWILFDSNHNEVQRASSIGLNPFFVNSDEVTKVASEIFPSQTALSISEIHFYGASCSSEARNTIIENGLRNVLINAKITVNHDLLAAARSACKNNPGIVCILGTGSNSCEYDGERIVDNVPALGYALGDEGSGTDLGRRLIQGWVYREMPEDLVSAFQSKYNIDKEHVLTSTYNEPKPNKFLASFAKFYSENRNHSYIQKLLSDAFQNFLDRHVMKYQTSKQVPINFVGSIAHAFSEELRACLTDRELKMGLVIKEPIEELCKYHLGK